MYIRRVQSLISCLDFEFNLLPFCKCFEAIHGDGGEVDKNVLTTLLFNESITLRIIEPLYLALNHCPPPASDFSRRLYRISPEFCQVSLVSGVSSLVTDK